MDTNKYFAFISYKREDEEWAIWFQHEMEHYHLPVTLNGRSDLPSEFRPVFRDIDELKAGNLPEQIYDALASSSYLIVVCSPNSAKSKWVNKEITDFIEIGKTKGIDNIRNIFPFIVDGTPHSQNDEDECFPKALRDLQDKEERIGGNVNENGRDKAFVKVLAGMLPNVAFDELWNRYEKDKAEEQRIERERRDNLLQLQSRFVAEKAMSIAEDDPYLARLLAVEVLPKDLENPDRPYTVEAEKLLRKSASFNHTILKGHRKVVNNAVFSPDGKFIVSASNDETIRIWEVESSKMLKVLQGHSASVNSAVFSPDGKLIVSASDDESVRIWDTETGCPLKILEGHSSRVNSASFSPNGKFIVSASNDKTIRIWEVGTGKMLKVLDGCDACVYFASFNVDGTRIVSESSKTSSQTWRLFHHNAPQISPLSMNTTICIWDIGTGKKIKLLKEHPNPMRLNPEIYTEKKLKILKERLTHDIFSEGFSPDDKLIVSISADRRTIRIEDAESGSILKILEGHNSRVNSASFSPNGKLIVSAHEDKTIRIWKIVPEAELIALKNYGEPIKTAVFSPSGTNIIYRSDNDTIRFVNTRTSHDIIGYHKENGMITSAIVSVNGTHVLSKHSDNTLCVLDFSTGQVLKVCHGCKKTVHSAVFLPDGRLIGASIIGLCTILIWDLETGQNLNMLQGHRSTINTAAFSPDGGRIVTASEDDTIRIWDVETGEELIQIECDDFIKNVLFTPDGKRVVSFSTFRAVLVWDAETGENLFVIENVDLVGRTSTVFNPAGEYLACIKKADIHIVDTATGRNIVKYESYDTIPVVSASFSQDGNYVFSAYADGTIRIWHFPPLQELIDQTRERFKDRPLTLEEREQYYLE